jgi:hypothetical protein
MFRAVRKNPTFDFDVELEAQISINQ